jgi:hypothetical protein
MKKNKIMLIRWWSGVSLLVAMVSNQAGGQSSFTRENSVELIPPFTFRGSESLVSTNALDPARATSGVQMIVSRDTPRKSPATVDGFDTARMQAPSQQTLSNLSTNNFRAVRQDAPIPGSVSNLRLSGDRQYIILNPPANALVQSANSLNTGHWNTVSNASSGPISLPIPSQSGDQAQFFRVFSVK